MDLIDHIPGIQHSGSFTPGSSTPAPWNVAHTGVTNGTGPADATVNVSEIYNRILLAVASVIQTAGLKVDNANWTQLAEAIVTPNNAVGAVATGLASSTPAAGKALYAAVQAFAPIVIVNPGDIHVDQLGADFTGSVDASAIVRAGLQTLRARGGGTLVFGPGQYKLTGTFDVPRNVKILGAGKWATYLHQVAAGAFLTRLETSLPGAQLRNESYIDLAHFCIVADVPGVIGIDLLLVGYAQIDKIEFIGCQTNVRGDRCNEITLLDCDARGSPTVGPCGNYDFHSTVLGDYSFNIKFTRPLLRNIGNGSNGEGAIQFTRVIGGVIEAISTSDRAQKGIVLRGDCQGCKILGGLINTATYGLYTGLDLINPSDTASAPYFCNVTSLDVDQPVNAAIYIEQGEQINILGGNMTSSGYNNAAGGILIGPGTATRPNRLITVTGIRADGFKDATGFGIQNMGASSVSVIGNTVSACGVGIEATADSANNFMVINNNLYQCTVPFRKTPGMAGYMVRNNSGAADVT